MTVTFIVAGREMTSEVVKDNPKTVIVGASFFGKSRLIKRHKVKHHVRMVGR